MEKTRTAVFKEGGLGVHLYPGVNGESLKQAGGWCVQAWGLENEHLRLVLSPDEAETHNLVT